MQEEKSDSFWGHEWFKNDGAVTQQRGCHDLNTFRGLLIHVRGEAGQNQSAVRMVNILNKGIRWGEQAQGSGAGHQDQLGASASGIGRCGLASAGMACNVEGVVVFVAGDCKSKSPDPQRWRPITALPSANYLIACV